MFELHFATPARNGNHPPSRRTEVRPKKRSKIAGGHIIETSCAKQRIEGGILAVPRVPVPTGVVIMNQQSRRPREIQSVADINMLEMGKMIDIAFFPRLPHALDFIIDSSRFWFIIEARPESRKRSLPAGGDTPLVIQSEIIGIEAQPRHVIGFKRGPPKDAPFRLFIGLHLIPQDRLHQKQTNAPPLIPSQLPMHPVKRIRRVTKVIPDDQAASAKVHRQPSNVQVGTETGFQHVVHREGCQDLQNVHFIPDSRSHVALNIIEIDPGILPFKQEFEILPVQTQPNAGPLLNLRVRSTRRLAASPGMVIRFKTRPVFESKIQPIREMQGGLQVTIPFPFPRLNEYGISRFRDRHPRCPFQQSNPHWGRTIRGGVCHAAPRDQSQTAKPDKSPTSLLSAFPDHHNDINLSFTLSQLYFTS